MVDVRVVNEYPKNPSVSVSGGTKTKALSAPGREWGTALRADSSNTGSTNLSVGFPVNKNSLLGAVKRALLAVSLSSFLLWRLLCMAWRK